MHELPLQVGQRAAWWELRQVEVAMRYVLRAPTGSRHGEGGGGCVRAVTFPFPPPFHLKRESQFPLGMKRPHLRRILYVYGVGRLNFAGSETAS